MILETGPGPICNRMVPGVGNAGLIVDGEETLLVDTLFDLNNGGNANCDARCSSESGNDRHAGEHPFER